MRKFKNPFEILLWLTLTFKCSCWADGIKTSSVETPIFEKGLPDVREIVHAAMEGEADDPKDRVGEFAVYLGTKIPLVGDLVEFMGSFASLIAPGSGLNAAIENAIADSEERSQVNGAIFHIRNILGAMKKEVNDMFQVDEQRKKNGIPADQNERISLKNHAIAKVGDVEWSIRSMLEFFNEPSLKKVPLVTAPLLIDICKLLAIFHQISKKIVGKEHLNQNIPCEAYDLLVAYRPRAVYARTQKLSLKYLYYDSVTEILAKPYNRSGYTRKSSTLHCKKGCSESEYTNEFCHESCSSVPSSEWYQNGCGRWCQDFGYDKFANCITDSLGGNTYKIGKGNGISCADDYLSLLRFRVEKMFPIDALKQLCHREPRKKSSNSNKNQHIIFQISKRKFVAYRLGAFFKKNLAL